MKEVIGEFGTGLVAAGITFVVYQYWLTAIESFAKNPALTLASLVAIFLITMYILKRLFK